MQNLYDEATAENIDTNKNIKAEILTIIANTLKEINSIEKTIRVHKAKLMSIKDSIEN